MTTPAAPLPTVHCWRIDLDAPRPAGSDQWIAPSEHARADRFKFDYLRRRYHATRAGLRTLLARELDIQPGEVRFVRSARGKPSLDPAHQSTLQFNLTHSDHVAWVAIGPMELGIDLEVLGRQVKLLDSLIHRVTTPTEERLLLAMPESLRELAFLLMWTRKESTLKAWGEGISGMGSLNTLDSLLPDAETLGQFLKRIHPVHVEAGEQARTTNPDARHPAGAHPVPPALRAADGHPIPSHTLPQVRMVYPPVRAAELAPGETRPALHATTLDLGTELVTVSAPAPFDVQVHRLQY